jgi:thymidylate kinase
LKGRGFSRAVKQQTSIAALAAEGRVKIISFSGIDGAGKTTQITALESWLCDSGIKVKLLTFWDDVVVGTRFREFMSQKAFKGDQGVGSPDKPLHRRDKNVSSTPLNLIRLCLYFADAINSRLKIAAQNGVDVLILDRYIYDELANLPLTQPLTRTFIRFVLSLVRKPDLALVIDADPVQARERKPEYPLEFIHKNREAYLNFALLSGDITVIEPLSVEQAAARIRQLFVQKVSSQEEKLCGLPALR